MPVMHPVLDQVRAALAAELAGKSAEAVARHPQGDVARWNGWQVVQHLIASWRSTSGGLADRMQKGRPLLTTPTPGQRIMQVAVTRLGFLPSGRQAPSEVRPPDGPSQPVSGDALIAAFTEPLIEMDRLLTAIEPSAGRAPVLTHFVLGPMAVENWRRFHRTHARHHVPQLRRALTG